MCNPRQKKLCGNKSCNTCFIRSLASSKEKTKSGNLQIKQWSIKNIISLITIFLNTHTEHWFDCDKCNHSFQKAPHKKKEWCPYCAGKRLCEDSNCIDCSNKSLENCKLKTKSGRLIMDFWDKIKNKIKPRQIFGKGDTPIYFNCPDCHHSIKKIAKDLTVNKTWCPYCSHYNKKLCKDTNCNFCYNNSLSSVLDDLELEFDYELNNCFDTLGNMNYPRMITIKSGKEYLFKHLKCGHSFPKIVANITDKQTGCPYCCNPPQKLCMNKKCTNCFNKSFANFNNITLNRKYKVDCWDKIKNNNSPRDVFMHNDSSKQWFICDVCNHSFDSTLYNICCGCWCPKCVYKTEKKLYKWLKKKFPKYTILWGRKECTFEWCKNPNGNGKFYPFDFCIIELNLIIELDGEQHFSQVSNWTCPNKTKESDIYKMKQAIKNGYKMIRILQEDVFKDKKNWEKRLYKSITNKKSQVHCHGSKYINHF